MPVYTPPALNAVDFALTARTPDNVDPNVITLTSYAAPALNAVDFSVSIYTPPTFNTADFELLDIATYFGILKWWTGAIWDRALLKVYTGGSFVQKPAYIWDGATWQEIDVTG